MAIIEMKKINLLIHQSKIDEVMLELQKTGVLEIETPKETDLKLETFKKDVYPENYSSASLDQAVSFLLGFSKKPILKTAIEGIQEIANEQKINRIAGEFDWQTKVKIINEFESSLNRLENEEKEIRQQINELNPWADLKLNLDEIKATAKTDIILATGQHTNISEFIQGHQKDNLLLVDEISSKALLIICLKEKTSTYENLIKTYDLEKVVLPISPQTAKQRIESLQKDLLIINHHREAIIKEIKALLIYLPELKILADYWHWQKTSYEASQNSLKTKSVIFLSGWAPKNKLVELEEKISNITDWYELKIIETEEEPPVEIENHPLIKPFESITRLYGLPGHKEIDPTAFLAGFFFVFFGLCLTDVTYGLFLMLVILLLTLFYRLPKGIKPLLFLIGLGGLSSVLVGLFFAGFGGLDPEKLPPLLASLQVFDPIRNPLPVFYFVLVLGFIQIIFGLIVKIIKDAKLGELKSGLLDNGPWLLFFAFLSLYIGNTFNLITFGPAGYLTLGSMVILVATQGRKETGLIKKSAVGVLSLYNIVGYFSDVLSYSRLLALGLSTTALAFSVNMIAGLVYEIIPVIGVAVAVVILIIGHLFNIVVNVLGAFVHSARLQFVEFFGKFLSKTGRPFRPLTRQERYVIIEN